MTDSCYVQFPLMRGKSSQELWDHCLEVADKVSATYPKPMKLEFEEAIYRFFFILTKKRYMYRQCGRDGIISDKIGKKGVLLARRDNSKVVRDIYEGLINLVADKSKPKDIMLWVIEKINSICNGSLQSKDFIITKSVGSVSKDGNGNWILSKHEDGGWKIGDYKVKKPTDDELEKKGVSLHEYYLQSFPAQVQLAEKIRRRGLRVDTGSRIEYVITNPDCHSEKQFNKIESVDYYRQHNNIVKIDYLWYVKALTVSLDQVLDIVLKPLGLENFTTEQYKYRLKCHRAVVNSIKDLHRPNIIFPKEKKVKMVEKK